MRRTGAAGTTIISSVDGVTGYALVDPWVRIYGEPGLPPDLSDVSDCEWVTQEEHDVLFIRGWNHVGPHPGAGGPGGVAPGARRSPRGASRGNRGLLRVGDESDRPEAW